MQMITMDAARAVFRTQYRVGREDEVTDRPSFREWARGEYRRHADAGILSPKLLGIVKGGVEKQKITSFGRKTSR